MQQCGSPTISHELLLRVRRECGELLRRQHGIFGDGLLDAGRKGRICRAGVIEGSRELPPVGRQVVTIHPRQQLLHAAITRYGV